MVGVPPLPHPEHGESSAEFAQTAAGDGGLDFSPLAHPLVARPTQASTHPEHAKQDNPGTASVSVRAGVTALRRSIEARLAETATTAKPETIGSVTLRPISDEPPTNHVGRTITTLDEFDVLVQQARRRQMRGGKNLYHEQEEDDRLAALELRGSAGTQHSAELDVLERFHLSDDLLADIKAATVDKGDVLSQTELRELGLANTDGAVDNDFKPDALNAINKSFFSTEIAFTDEARPASFFATNRPINHALGGLMADKAGVSGRPLRVKELCAGADNEHWQYAVGGAIEAGATGIDMTVTDFVEPAPAPENSRGGLTLSSEQYSLLEPMPALPEADCYDAIVATYGFDSVWMPEDMTLAWVDGKPYQQLYRVKVPELHPRRDKLLEALRAGKPLANASKNDYKGLFTERVLEPIDLDQHPYGSYIRQLEGKQMSTAFPGGLIKRVVEAFNTQLSPNGVFVSADTADAGWSSASNTSPWAISGAAARYRAENYYIAKRILEEVHGLDVDLLSFNQLAMQYLPPQRPATANYNAAWRMYNNSDHAVLVARRRNRV